MNTILTADERNRIIDSMYWSLDDQERGDMHRLIQAVLDKLAQQSEEPFNAAKIPEGYQLVPIERDHNMRCSAIAAYNVNWASRKSLGEVLDAVWAAQLKDAPEPPMAEAVSIEELEHEIRLVRARNERLEKESADRQRLVREAVAAEREACAKVAADADHMGSVNAKLIRNRIVSAIRARGETQQPTSKE